MHFLRRLLLVMVAWLVPAVAVHADAAEAALKVAFLYNFTLYTEWPEPTPVFELCVAGKDDLGETLDALSRKEVAGRPIQIRRIPASTDVPASCQLLFVAAAESARLSRLLAPLANRAVLTVAEIDSSHPARPMLRLSIQDARLGFDANQTAARTAGLRLSSKMLRLARSVE